MNWPKTTFPRFFQSLFARYAGNRIQPAEAESKILTNPFIAGTYLPSDPTGLYHLGLKRPGNRDDDINLPVPPREFWEGYGKDEQAYLASGQRHMTAMHKILQNAGCTSHMETAVLDFGCAAGRMLRFFPQPRSGTELWGVDVNAKYINWCQCYLSPPFLFATITTLPHLPFEDGYFDLIYSGSVFTHIPSDLADTWLLELRRVLRDGGMAYITIQDRTSIKMMLSHDDVELTGDDVEFANGDKSHAAWEKADGDPGSSLAGRYWIKQFDDTIDLCSLDFSCFSFSSNGLNVFYDIDYLADRWSRFFEVVSITPRAYGCQTALLLRKRTLHSRIK